MIARCYDPAKDFEQVKALLGEKAAVNPERDLIVVVEIAGKIVEVVAMSPCLFVHDFNLACGAMRRMITDCAMAYAMGAARALGHREAMVLVDEANFKMRHWWEEHGAKQQPEGSVYVVEIK